MTDPLHYFAAGLAVHILRAMLLIGIVALALLGWAALEQRGQK
jgi:hypothetical protein